MELTIDVSLTCFAFGVSYSARYNVLMIFIGPVLVTLHLSVAGEGREDSQGAAHAEPDDNQRAAGD